MIAVEVDKKTGQIINIIVVDPTDTPPGDRLFVVTNPLPDPKRHVWNGSEFVLNAEEQAALVKEQEDYDRRWKILAAELAS